jgi:hypothetical protein
MTLGKRLLTVVEGGNTDRSKRIAMSFVVHERKRLDVPASALLSVEASAGRTYFIEGGGSIWSNSPSVEIDLAPDFQAKLYKFTADIIGEVMEVHVGNRCVARPVVREQLGKDPSFQISAFDIAEAEELAEVLRNGWSPQQIK